jgi:predicted nucleic acid-binding protein
LAATAATNPAPANDDALTVCADRRIAFLPDPDALEREFRARSLLASRSPKVWADAYLLAFAATAGLKLITFDRALLSRGVDVLLH